MVFRNIDLDEVAERREREFAAELDNLLRVLTPEQEQERAERLRAAKTPEEKLDEFREACEMAVKAWDRADGRPEWMDMEFVVELMRRLLR